MAGEHDPANCNSAEWVRRLIERANKTLEEARHLGAEIRREQLEEAQRSLDLQRNPIVGVLLDHERGTLEVVRQHGRD
ncbi:hypothetical protein [Nocardia sp. XZ_19_369]|uniref:hypothetical protein n=1 Tax=Nocardia sp. XZ_19_369 TaxID=2769487 RepID=UPI00189046EE|nr:hypothetical protein [Nocardia sp. XZ_19_369]